MTGISSASRAVPETRSERMERYRRRIAQPAFWGSIGWVFFRAVLIFGIAFIIIHPLLIKFSSALMTEADLYDLTVKWIPSRLELRYLIRNFQDVYYEMNYLRSLMNSLSLALVVSVLQLVSCTVVGYGLARYPYPGSGILFAFVILTLLVPPQMVMIPLFLNFRFFDIYGLLPEPLNLLGTFWPFILTSLTGMGLRNGLFIYIMRQFFRGMPKDLEEAAMVDGANPIGTFLRIMLPGAGPALLIVFLFSFVWQYNDLFLTTVYMRRTAELLPFSLSGIARAFSDYPAEYVSVLLNTGMILFIAPLLILYAFLQRYFIESVERTGLIG